LPLDPSLKPFFPDVALSKSQVRRKQRSRHPLPEPYSAEDVLFQDVRGFLGEEYVDQMLAREGEEEWEIPEGLKGRHAEVELRVGAFTVTGQSESLLVSQLKLMDV
jgi:tRNA (uracil-5-)-methyltransferase